MSRIQERHPLGVLLAQDLDPRQPADFVALLAAYALADDAELRSAAETRLSNDTAAPEELKRYWRSVLDALPHDARDEEVWLVEVEALALAQRAVADGALGGGHSAWLDEFAAGLEACRASIAEHHWMNALVAAESWHGSLPDVTPWPEIRSAVDLGVVRREGDADTAVLDAWLEGRLSRADAEALTEWVATPGSWREAYRGAIADFAQRAVIPRFDVTRTVSVAADDAEYEHGQLIQDLPLPHLGPSARREGRLHAAGTTWRLLDAPTRRTEIAEHGCAVLNWADDVLGVLKTELQEREPNDLAVARDALFSVGRIADGLEHPRAIGIASAAADDLRAGSLHRGLQAAATAFIDGKLNADDELDWASVVLQMRVALEDAGHRLDNADVDAAIARADAAMAPLDSGLLLLEPEHVRDITGDHAVDPAAWWGVHARLDRALPDALVVAALEDSEGVTLEATPSNVLYLGSKRADVTPMRAEDSPTGYLAAAGSGRVAGETLLLVRLDSPGNEGRVIRASVKLGGGGLFAVCPRLSAIARDAVRDAYKAAASLCPAGFAPHLLGEHQLVLNEDDLADISLIDGRSLGLPLALGFASLWSKGPLPDALAATGRLFFHGGWQVAAVDHVRAKASALLSMPAQRRCRMMTHEDHSAEIRAAGHDPEPVATLEDAVRCAGLDLTQTKPAWPDAEARRRAIDTLARAIELQEIAAFEGSGDPWSLVADEMEMLLGGSSDGDDDERVIRGRLYGALARVHAGDLDGAARFLAAVQDVEDLPWANVLHRLVELAAAIDEGDPARCNELDVRLEASIGQLPAGDTRKLTGPVLGTRGRVRLHSGDATSAIPFLERAVEHHSRVRTWELGRSRMYLACALRNAGRLQDAAEQLALAANDLATKTKPESGSYYGECHMYWLYERARLSIAQGRGQAAADEALEAYGLAARGGFYPKLGIMRALAWAHRLLSDDEEADRYVMQIEALNVPYASLKQTILEEARQFPFPGGEVY